MGTLQLPFRFERPREPSLRHDVLEAFVVERNAKAGHIWKHDASPNHLVLGCIQAWHGCLVPLHKAEPFKVSLGRDDIGYTAVS